MNATTRPLEPHVVLIQPPGDVTAEQAKKLRDECRRHLAGHKRDFVIDLSGVGFVDSAGLEWLLWLQDAAADVLGQVRLVALNDNVREILRITRLAPVFQFHPDADAAVKSLKV